jgi:phosphate transport system substrate-binding protein
MFKVSRLLQLILVGLMGLTLLVACGDSTPPLTPAPVPTLSPTNTPVPATALPANNPGQRFGNPGASPNVEILGGGSTLADPIYNNWFTLYNNNISKNVKFTYQATSSGNGRSAFLGTPITATLSNGQRASAPLDFAGSDAAFTGDELVKAAQAKGEVVHIPIALGGVAIAYHLNGFTGELRLSGTTLARIYLGQIKKWDDPTILAENPGQEIRTAGAGKDIKPIIRQRGQGSGTTEIFTRYLSAVSSEFRDQVGPGSSPKWLPALTLEGNSNEAIATQITNTDGSLGYIDLNAADKLSYASIRNQTGRYIKPTAESITAAAQGLSIPDDFRIFVVNAEGETAYPISGFTWLVTWRDFGKMPNPSQVKAEAMFNFLWWAIHDGQANLPKGFAPLPVSLVPRLETLFVNNDTPCRTFLFNNKPLFGQALSGNCS